MLILQITKPGYWRADQIKGTAPPGVVYGEPIFHRCVTPDNGCVGTDEGNRCTNKQPNTPVCVCVVVYLLCHLSLVRVFLLLVSVVVCLCVSVSVLSVFVVCLSYIFLSFVPRSGMCSLSVFVFCVLLIVCVLSCVCVLCAVSLFVLSLFINPHKAICYKVRTTMFF